MRPIPSLALVGLTLFVAGCKPAEDAEAPAPEPIAFKGTTRPEFVGNWTSTDGKSKLNMTKTGEVSMSTTANTRKGPQTVQKSGQWLSEEGVLVLSTKEGTGTQVLRYFTKHPSPDTMELRGKSDSKMVMTYHRAK